MRILIIVLLLVLVGIQADIIQNGDCIVAMKDQGGHHFYLQKGQYTGKVPRGVL